MKTILLVRHAKAEAPAPGQRDFDRPLAPRGRADAKRMGEALRAMTLVPGELAASSARRAVETATELAAGMRFGGTVRREGSLYEAEGDAWLAALRRMAASVDVAMLVGHSPGIEQAAALLLGAPPRFIDCPTAGVVGLEAGVDSWKDLGEGAAVLRLFLRPKVVEAIG